MTQDLHQITQYLMPLSNQELINVGMALGLSFPKLKKMSSEALLNDMVHAWLRMDDNVQETPSWGNLCKALEGCGHKGIATGIKEGGVNLKIHSIKIIFFFN